MGSQYDLPPDGRIRVLSASGAVTVIAEERDDVDVEPGQRGVELKEGGRGRHRHHGGLLGHLRSHEHGEGERQHRPVLEVKAKSGNIEVRCPIGTDVSVGWLLVVFAGWCLVRWWSTRAAARPPSPTNPNQP